jgi:hypothetical protein
MKSKKVMGVFSINTSLCPLHPQVMLGPFLSVDFHEIGLGRTSGDGEKARALPPSPQADASRPCGDENRIASTFPSLTGRRYPPRHRSIVPKRCQKQNTVAIR